MIQESIVLYDEPLPVEKPKEQTTQQYPPWMPKTTYTSYTGKTYSVIELTQAVMKAAAEGFKVGAYFQYNNDPTRFFVKRLETRPVFVDEIKGEPGIIYACRVGTLVETPFSLASLEGAYVCDDSFGDK